MKPYREHMLAVEREYWEEMLACHRTVKATAAAAGINRKSLYPILRRVGLRSQEIDYRYARRGRWTGALVAVEQRG